MGSIMLSTLRRLGKATGEPQSSVQSKEGKDVMRDLLERLRAATKGSRELDAKILKVIGDTGALRVPHYTESVDAALTLVPERYNWVIYQDDIARHRAFLIATDDEDALKPYWSGDDIPTPALALCIAALEAREKTG